MNIDALREELIDSKKVQLETIYRLSAAFEYYDSSAGKHICRMSHYCAALGRRLGWSAERLETIRYSASLHDIGKVGVPENILIKPGRLTPEERTIMQNHAAIGARILGGSNAELLKVAETIALTHHERWDGSGYPTGLKGTGIPPEGRIATIADVFDALCSARLYRGPLSFEEALGILKEDSGKQFDPDYVIAFSEITDEISAIGKEYRDTEA